MSTDYEKWRDASKTWGAQNPSRAEFTASLLPPGVHVLDIGAGSMVLKRHLKAGTRYTPCDIHDRGEGCIVADLNKGEFPPGRYDWIAMIGTIEYVIDVQAALAKVALGCRNAIITYNFFNPGGPDTREVRVARGWLNHIPETEFELMLEQAGLSIISKPQVCWYVTGSRIS